MEINPLTDMIISQMVLLLLLLCVKKRTASAKDEDIVSSLIKELKIKQCVLIENRSTSTVENVKYFAEKNIFTTYMKAGDFPIYLQDITIMDKKTLIVLRNVDIALLFKNIDKVRNDFKIKNYLYNKKQYMISENIRKYAFSIRLGCF